MRYLFLLQRDLFRSEGIKAELEIAKDLKLEIIEIAKNEK